MLYEVITPAPHRRGVEGGWRDPQAAGGRPPDRLGRAHRQGDDRGGGRHPGRHRRGREGRRLGHRDRAEGRSSGRGLIFAITGFV